MKCDKCLTEVKFSNKDELFFFTPEGYKPCEDCQAKFDKIKNWTNNMIVQLPLQIAAELINGVSDLKKTVDALKGTKKNKKGWFTFK